MAPGLRRAGAQGDRLGRPPRVFYRNPAALLYQAGKPIRAIAQEHGVSRGTVQRVLKVGQKPFADFWPRAPRIAGPADPLSGGVKIT